MKKKKKQILKCRLGQKSKNLFFQKLFGRALGDKFFWLQPKDAQSKVLQVSENQI